MVPAEQHMATVGKKNQVKGVPATCCYRLELATVIWLYPLSMHQDALAEVEEKYRKAMVSNAQLDNEKNNLMYQVDTLKDSLMELEELLTESRREYEEKVKVRQTVLKTAINIKWKSTVCHFFLCWIIKIIYSVH